MVLILLCFLLPEEQHGRSTRVIETDFTQGPEIYESIQTALQSLEIGILGNRLLGFVLFVFAAALA